MYHILEKFVKNASSKCQMAYSTKFPCNGVLRVKNPITHNTPTMVGKKLLALITHEIHAIHDLRVTYDVSITVYTI